MSGQPPGSGRSSGRRDSSSRRLPKSLVGCFPGDPAWAWGLLTDREDWSFGDLELPDDVFVDGPGSGSEPQMEITGSISIEAATQGRPDPRATARSTAMGTRRSGREAGLPAPGSVIDKYRVEGLLGTGGFAAVYRATHLLLRIPVALKLLRPKVLKQRPLLAELLCEEARFAAQLNHPNVVRVFDVTHNPKITYIVMEFIDGESLYQAIRRKGRLRPFKAVRVGIDVTLGLKGALDQGLIHRDIKPANILLARSGVAKIVDLGLAQQSDELGRNRSSETGAMIVGTPMYMAPEQASRPEDVDFRADVYSLGATLYHAATGHAPFEDDDPMKVLARHHKEPVRPPEQLAPGIAFELSRLLMWMLEKDRTKRPDYDQLLAGLDEARQAVALEEGIEGLVG
jgi:eukaryotic-like serine/threonine-protein kinase